MPRSYLFEHFKVPKPVPSFRGGERDKLLLSQSRAQTAPQGGLHYGHRFAETEELYRQHGRTGSENRAPFRRSGEVRTSPIGALPFLEQPEPARGFGDALDEGRRHLRALAVAARDFSFAASKLLALPFSLARLVAWRSRMRLAEGDAWS